jgi:hypothetical protein
MTHEYRDIKQNLLKKRVVFFNEGRRIWEGYGSFVRIIGPLTDAISLYFIVAEI